MVILMEQSLKHLLYQRHALEGIGISLPQNAAGLHFPQDSWSRLINTYQLSGGVERLRDKYNDIVAQHAGNSTMVHSLSDVHTAASYAYLIEGNHHQSAIALINFWTLMEMDELLKYLKSENHQMTEFTNGALDKLKKQVTAEFFRINQKALKGWPDTKVSPLINVLSAYDLARPPNGEEHRIGAREALEKGLWHIGYTYLSAKTIYGLGEHQTTQTAPPQLEKIARSS